MSLSVENNQSTGITIPAISTATGAIAGATILAPAKYKNVYQLVEEACKNDKFINSVLKTPENASEQTKTAFQTISKSVAKYANDYKTILKSIFGDKTEIKWNEIPIFDDITETLDVTKKRALALKSIADTMTKENLINGIDITDAMKEGFKKADGSFDLDEFKKYFEEYKLIIKQEGDKIKLVDSELVSHVENIAKYAALEDAPKELNELVIEAKNTINELLDLTIIDNKNTYLKQYQILELVDNNGNVKRADFKKLLKNEIKFDLDLGNIRKDLNDNFKTIQKSLGKNRIIGAILYGAGALVAGLGIKAVIDGKKNA